MVETALRAGILQRVERRWHWRSRRSTRRRSPITATMCCTCSQCPRCWPAASSPMRRCAATTCSAWRGASIPTSPPSCSCAGTSRNWRRVVGAVPRGPARAPACSWQARCRTNGARCRRHLPKPCSCRCWRSPCCRPSSATTWPSRCCCAPAAACSRSRNWRSAARKWRGAWSRCTGSIRPEFFDRALFEGFLSLLRRRGVIRADGEGRLVFDDVLERIASDAQLVLSEQLRHSILQVVHG